MYSFSSPSNCTTSVCRECCGEIILTLTCTVSQRCTTETKENKHDFSKIPINMWKTETKISEFQSVVMLQKASQSPIKQWENSSYCNYCTKMKDNVPWGFWGRADRSKRRRWKQSPCARIRTAPKNINQYTQITPHRNERLIFIFLDSFHSHKLLTSWPSKG